MFKYMVFLFSHSHLTRNLFALKSVNIKAFDRNIKHIEFIIYNTLLEFHRPKLKCARKYISAVKTSAIGYGFLLAFFFFFNLTFNL